MCGFAGVIAWDEKYRVSRETLAKMSAAIAHRGPDGEGTYFSPDAEITPDRPQVALAHRRLAIIDPDPRGNQPFTDNEGRWLVFNGEIYNYRELRAELESLKPEYQWRTDCDTEVLLVAYSVWGEKCVEHFNGMFAFAIWDGVKRELFLARDRMGQKPLYFAVGASNFPEGESGEVHIVGFASELSALRPLSWRPRTIGAVHLSEYLKWGVWPTEELEPGTTRRSSRTIDIHGWQSTTYFQPDAFDAGPDRRWNDGDARKQTRDLVRRAVSRQLVADVPIGCFLSGGVDSSVIASAMKDAVSGGQRVCTFSVGFEDARYDERPHAAAVARHLGTSHREFLVRPSVVEDLPKLAGAFGVPFADSSALPTFYLARETRADVKVALSGDGGDELFGGYDRYRAMRLGQTLRRLPGQGALRSTLKILRSGHQKSVVTRFRRLVGSLTLPPAERYAGYLRLFDDAAIRGLMICDGALHARFVEERLRDPDPIVSRFRLLNQNRDVVEAALATDRVTYLPDDLLTKVDRASMLHALEVRSPFMDHELVQFAAGLTTDQLLKGGPKRMLREAFADDLPAWVFKRKKMGFAVPIGDWFRAELRPMLHDHLFASDSFGAAHFNKNVVRQLVAEHEQFKIDHSQRLYALLMLELWWKGQRA